ncbi:RNA 3 -terminal phosphate cyclase [Colletotrichum truncatum]|uniref:RNA 3 -terminal phosphate cyclase n=1 Tax=Colletotrichum truncatum TaxID=5467 RepID=A0ACC3YZF7_COLTU|nr:RNA 3 -terminal phosphate cyclase [Colletotrichum truncatum]KAF6786235.1 RNA 3 -terminal phosphate cyclase [Colletotrichum truncatum]
MASRKIIELDGRTGEGGGQLVRVATALAAVTTQPVRITNVRGNRPSRSGGNGGGIRMPPGLKAQHVTAIRWLAEATEADVKGLEVGSSTLTFEPRIPPSTALEGRSRWIKIVADTGAASTLLILQAILPFLLYTADGEEEPTPVELEITGGTNVGMSLSYEYLDQVLLPRLEDVFGVNVGRRLKQRGWSLGPQSRGSICLTVHPLKRGQALRSLKSSPGQDSVGAEVRYVDVSMVVPSHMHSELQNTLVRDISNAFPEAEVDFKLIEDSGHDARIYTLLVARSASGSLRWGSDILMSTPKKGKQKDSVASLVSRKVVSNLAKELAVKTSSCDEFLQDQLVIFQALASGRTSFPRGIVAEGADVGVLEQNVAQLDLGERMRRDKTDKPFGQGSMHSQTARWVASEIMPTVEWYNKGAICKGAGTSFS